MYWDKVVCDFISQVSTLQQQFASGKYILQPHHSRRQQRQLRYVVMMNAVRATVLYET